jgi:hypothetical protein
MIKRFCDLCGVEVKRNYVTERLEELVKYRNGEVFISITTGVNGVNSGDICLSCLVHAVNRLDNNSPKEEKNT